MLEIPLSSYLYGCQFYYDHVTLSILDVKITTSTIPNIYYTVGSGAVSSILPAFANNKGITNDPKLNIIYDVQTNAGMSFSTIPFINSFNPSTRVINL